MHYSNFPGYGDEATWGGRTPYVHDYTGPVFFEINLGHGDGVNVMVIGETNGHELNEIKEVIYQGIDIYPTIEFDAYHRILKHYERHSEAINKAAMTPDD